MFEQLHSFHAMFNTAPLYGRVESARRNYEPLYVAEKETSEVTIHQNTLLLARVF